MRPVWLQGSSVTSAVPPRARSPAARRAWTSACGPCGPLVPALARRTADGVQDDTADHGVGAGVPEPARGELNGSAHRRDLDGGCGGHRVLLPLRARTPGLSGRQKRKRRHGNTAAGKYNGPSGKMTGRAADGGVPKLARRALPPIRTFTVGAGISPAQPAAGCGRVADCYRRFGITPTPECAAAFMSVRLQSATPGHGPCERSPVGCLTAPGAPPVSQTARIRRHSEDVPDPPPLKD